LNNQECLTQKQQIHKIGNIKDLEKSQKTVNVLNIRCSILGLG